MADEFDLDALDTDIEKENKIEKRIKDLSEKVRLTSEERDEKDKLVKDRDEKIVGLEKERDFFSSFGDSVAKYPQASEFKDAIKEKVLHGYTVEDATISVLAKEGKLESGDGRAVVSESNEENTGMIQQQDKSGEGA